jgi:Glutathione S-transferase, N-terminal domain
MNPIITAFERSPDRGRGLARDMRVRWALEGQPYDVRLLSFSEMKQPAHRALHPFGQIPTYEEGDLVLFESGAIVFHIAERHAGPLPGEANARARVITWMFAALSTMEPAIARSRQTAGARQGLVRAAPENCRGSHPWPAHRTIQLPWRCRMARRFLQRRRPLDGVGAAQAEWIGPAGRISEPLGLCRPRRSAARLQARLRCSIGGFFHDATSRPAS